MVMQVPCLAAPALKAGAGRVAVPPDATFGSGIASIRPPWHSIRSRHALTHGRIRFSIDPMRTTLDLPAALMDEAQKLLGFKSKTDTVVLSLTELVRRRRIEELRGLLGRVDLDLDLDRSRRRPLPAPESPRPRRRRARA